VLFALSSLLISGHLSYNNKNFKNGYIEAIKEGFRLVNRVWQLVLVQLSMMFISGIGFLFSLVYHLLLHLSCSVSTLQELQKKISSSYLKNLPKLSPSILG